MTMLSYYKKLNKILYLCIVFALGVAAIDAVYANEFYDVYEPEDQWIEISEPSLDGVVDVFNPETGELTQETLEKVYDNSDNTEVETFDIEDGEFKTYYNRD